MTFFPFCSFSGLRFLSYMLVLLVLCACGGSDGSAPVNDETDDGDTNGEQVVDEGANSEAVDVDNLVTFPISSSNLGGVISTVVSGKITATDGSEINASHGVVVSVNGYTAEFDAAAPEFWSVSVPVSAGEDILSISVVDGVPSEESMNIQVSNVPEPRNFSALAVNSVQSQLYIGDATNEAIYVLDLNDGNLSHLLSEDTPDSLLNVQPVAMKYDQQSLQVLLLSEGDNRLIGIDPNSGLRRVVADLPSNSFGYGRNDSIMLVPENSRAFVLLGDEIFSVDINSGDVALVADLTPPNGLVDDAGHTYGLGGEISVVYDPINGEFVIVAESYHTSDLDAPPGNRGFYGGVLSYNPDTQIVTPFEGEWYGDLLNIRATLVSDDELNFCTQGGLASANIRTRELGSGIFTGGVISPSMCNSHVSPAVDRAGSRIFFSAFGNLYNRSLVDNSILTIGFPLLAAGTGVDVNDIAALSYDTDEHRLLAVDNMTSEIIAISTESGERSTIVERTIANMDSYEFNDERLAGQGLGIFNLDYQDNHLVYARAFGSWPSNEVPDSIVKTNLLSGVSETLRTSEILQDQSDEGSQRAGIWGLNWDEENERILLSLSFSSSEPSAPTDFALGADLLWFSETDQSLEALNVNDDREGSIYGGHVISNIDTRDNRVIAWSDGYPERRIDAYNLSTGVQTPIWNFNLEESNETPSILFVQGIKLDTENNRALLLDGGHAQLAWIDLDSGEVSLASSFWRGPGNGPDIPNTARALELDLETQRAYVLIDRFTPHDRFLHKEIMVVELRTGERAILSR